MRHRAPRPLLDLRYRLPRATARLLGRASGRGPFRALAALVLLSLATGTYAAVTSMTDMSSQQRRESAAGRSRDAEAATESRDFDRPTGGTSQTTPPSALPTPVHPTRSVGSAPVTPGTREPGPTASGSPSGSATPSPSPSASAPDREPPETTLSAEFREGDSARFSFSANESATFACSLDGAAFTSCESPTTYSGLDAGWHTFAVRATDAAGNVDPTPAETRWHAEGHSADE